MLHVLQTTDADKAFAEFDALSAQRNQSLSSGGSSSPTSSGSSSSSSSASGSDRTSGIAELKSFGGLACLLAIGLLSGVLFV